MKIKGWTRERGAQAACCRRSFLRRGGARGRACVGLVVGLMLLVVGGSASAAIVPFDPAQPTVFIAQGSPTLLDQAQQSGGAITFTPVGATIPGLTYNAIGYDTCNNFIYAVQTSTANGGTPGSIIQIAGNGSISYTGINVGAGFNVGAFGPDANCDDFYVGNSGGSTLSRVNLSTGVVTPIGVGVAGPDLTYSNGYFWSMPAPNQIQRINVTPGQLGTTTFTVSTPPVGTSTPSGPFGAAWTYGNGNVGFSNNTTGNIYQIAIANASSSSPTFTTVLSQAGPASSNNDGTNAPGLSTDLALTKTASPAMVDPGAKISYTLTITNNGPGRSSGYALSDTLPAGVTNAATTSPGCNVSAATVVCAGAPLAAGASVTDTITVNAPSPFPAPITNKATVTANESDPNPANNTASATVNPNVVTVSLVKSALVTPSSDQGGANVGDTIAYAYNVTNTGNVPLTSVAVSDPTAGSVACPAPAAPGLAPGASETCNARSPYLVKQGDVDAGSITDTATATGTDATNFTSAASAPSSTTVPAVAAAPSLVLQKVASASLGDSTPIQAGETIQYSYVVTNTGNVDLATVSVSDPTGGPATCPTPAAPGLAPGDTEICTETTPYVVTQSDVDHNGVTDTATATGTDLQGSAATSPPATVDSASLPSPAVAVAKTATVTPAGDQNAAKVGDTIRYSYAITNVGNVDLASVAVSDPSAGTVSCPAPSGPGLAPGASEACTAPVAYTVTQSDVDAGAITDTATATGIDNAGNRSAPSNPSTATILTVAGDASVSVIKAATVSPAADQTAAKVGDTIQYSYTVTNTGNITLTSVAVDDPSAGNVTCPTPAGAGLAPGKSELCAASHPYTVTQGDVDAGAVSDSATATGVDTQGAQSEPSAASTVTVPAVAAAPAVSLAKSATVDPAADQTAVQVGDRISYAYKVTNVGNVTLVSVAVSDPAAGSVTCATPAAPGLAPGQSETCTADDPHPVTQVDIDGGGVTDTATATGIDTRGTHSPSSSPATVTVPGIPAAPAVTVQKFANAANGDTSPISQGEQIQYSFLVTNTGNVDLTALAVSDNTVGAVSCPTPAAPGLAPGGVQTCTATYTATAQDARNNNITNTATATGTDAAGAKSPTSAPATFTIPQGAAAPAVLIHKSATATPSSDQDGVVVGDHISYAYVVTNAGNVNLSSVAVSDVTAGHVTCPPLSTAGLSPGASVTCTEDVAYQVTQADVDSGSVTDVATATGTATVAGSSVTSPASPPASVTIPAAVSPAVSIVKSGAVAPSADQHAVTPGDTIQYSYLVTNIGNTTLQSISVSDSNAGRVTCPTPAPPGLAPGAVESCSAASPYVVSQADVDAGAVADTATASGTDLLGTPSPAASGSATIPAEAADPELSLVKNGTVSPPADQGNVKVGDTIKYRYVVTNTGDVTLTTFAVIDPTLGRVSCPTPAAPGLAPGASVTCTSDESYTVAQADIDNGGATDEATATGADAKASSTPTATARDTERADRNPQVSLVKKATVVPAADQDDAGIGDVIAYSFDVTNTGNVDLTSLSVADPSLGAVSCPIPAPPGLTPGASETCSGETQHVVDPQDQIAGNVTNTATATGTDDAGDRSPPSTPSSDTVPVGHAAQPPAPTPPASGPPAGPPATPPTKPPAGPPATRLAVHKRVSRATAYPGQTLTYTVTVTNDGPATASEVKLTDVPSIPIKVRFIHTGEGHCHTGDPITCALGTLSVGKTDRIVIAGEVQRSGVEHNTAEATSADRALDPAGARSTATTRVAPILQVHKRASLRVATTGQNVIYEITVTNPTLVAIRKVGVCDALPSGLLYVGSRPRADDGTGRPCWTIHRLRAGATKRFGVTANVAPGARGRRVNHATAGAPGVRSAQATAAIRVTPAPRVPCGIASRAPISASGRTSPRSPVARAAC
ncbi:MAG: hypothetical protein WAL63_17210 [Solirubrobacteraceae bacterium]